jgi:hypothetical protein
MDQDQNPTPQNPNGRRFLCYDCRHVWTVPYGVKFRRVCPECGSRNVHRHPRDRGYNRNGRGRGGGGRGRGNGSGRGNGRGNGSGRGRGNGRRGQ